MTDINPTPTSIPAAPLPRSKKTVPIVAAVLAAGAIAAVATTSFGQGFEPGYGAGPGYGRGMGPGFGSGGEGPGFGPGWRHGGPGFWRGGTIDPAQAEARVDRMVRHFAVDVGANADQQEKLSTIAKGLVKDMLPVREKMIAARKQARELLTAQTIDRAALEKLRADQIAAHDAASKRVVQALADAAEVLTPEQRTKLSTVLENRGGWGFGRGWGHGMGWGRGMGWGHGMMGGWR